VRMRSRIPVVLLACGSFNPTTNVQLRLFELARDHTGRSEGCGLAKAQKRFNTPLDQLLLYSWRISSHRNLYFKRRYCYNEILRAFQSKEEFMRNKHPTECSTGDSLSCQQPVLPELKLLCGADVLQTFKTPKLWKEEDIKEIVEKFGLVCISQAGSHPSQYIQESDLLSKSQHNIFLVREWIQNEIRATQIRSALGRGLSVKH
ncbi:NMNA3 adenylyltransferase, partial [Picathartes gymnocephalus]|nr:NMNA3 adenylyltransferase [Picathartes gymnocephalus]